MKSYSIIWSTVGILILLFFEGCHCSNLFRETCEDSLSVNESTLVIESHRSETWERGYRYGYEDGVEDAWDLVRYGDHYNESGKGGDFLKGYNAGYEDGFDLTIESMEEEF